jgi:gluconate kinase
MVSRLPMLLSRLLLLIVGSIYLLSPKIDALRPLEKSLFVVFGRPGSGKSTVANEAFGVLSRELKNRDSLNIECVALDLDVCVTHLMRDNFGKGMYPTLEERKVFAVDACNYVEVKLSEICQQKEDTPDSICAIISFSFVNTDLREIFRTRFPILIDTTEEECTKRINEREDHFYKGEVPAEDTTTERSEESSVTNDDDEDNSDWKFAPVAFPHTVLDGFNSVEDNANKVAEKILEETRSK